MMQKQSTGFEIKTDWYKNRRHKNKEGTKRNNKRKHVTNVTMLDMMQHMEKTQSINFYTNVSNIKYIKKYNKFNKSIRQNEYYVLNSENSKISNPHRLFLNIFR